MLTVDGVAYDVSGFAPRHPGGARVLQRMQGRDATDAFYALHPPRAHGLLRGLPRAHGAAARSEGALQRALREVDRGMRADGWYEPAYAFYGKLGVGLALLFACAVALTARGAWVSGALATAAFWQQAAGLGHDLGHSSVFRRREHNLRAGSWLSAVTGLSSVWWRDDHFTHHLECNSVEGDPNIQHLPFFAVAESFFAPTVSAYHQRETSMGPVARWLVRRQHWLFYPLMAVARFQLYALGVAHLLRRPDEPHARTELAGVAAFLCGVAALALRQPSWAAAAGWVLLSHAAAGVLHVQIVLSHWAMAVRPADAAPVDWFTHTLQTTMDVTTDYDWLHLGLQYQIEHHMFPRLPRPRLRQARARVRAALRRLDGGAPPCVERSFLGANAMLLRHLRGVASRVVRS